MQITIWEEARIVEDQVVRICQGPGSGNAEILAKLGTPAQQQRWLRRFLRHRHGRHQPGPGAPHERASMIILPTDAAGFQLVRSASPTTRR